MNVRIAAFTVYFLCWEGASSLLDRHRDVHRVM